MAANSGINSPQYTCVRENLVNLTGYLQNNASAELDLVRQFQAKGWLTCTPGNKVDADALLALVLERIRFNPNEYDTFVAMLEEVTGTESIVNTLRGTTYIHISHVCALYAECSLFFIKL